MKKLLVISLLLAALLPAIPAEADVPGLQVNPLQYEDTITTSSVKLGYIEVSNPSDTTITLQSNVQGFRQKDNAGRLSFFDDPQISDGIKVDLARFDLGAHEAIRVAFSVDPTKLPKGGVYAVIFFRTIPPAQSANSSYVAESANIGTLLLLQNGGPGVHVGQIKGLNLPFWQLGNGITGTLNYTNTDRSTTAVGFRPALTARVLPWGSAPRLETGLVLPSSERQFAINRPGSFLGLLPLTLTDADSHQNSTGWVFAITGWYQLLVIILLLAFITLWVISRFTKLNLRPFSSPLAFTYALVKNLSAQLRRLDLPWRRRPAPVRRSLDTISRKPFTRSIAEPVTDIIPDPEVSAEPETVAVPTFEPSPEAAPKTKPKNKPKTTPRTRRKPKPKAL